MDLSMDLSIDTTMDGNQCRTSLEPSLYDVLDLQPEATRLEIREAYLRLKSTYGAGSAALYSLIGEDEAKMQLARIEDAFRVLGDEILRRDYDQAQGFGVEATQPQRYPVQDYDAVAAPGSVAEQLGLGAERIMRMREQAATTFGGVPPVAPAAPIATAPVQRNMDVHGGVVNTSRSSLPVIKLKAMLAESDDVAAKYEAILSAGDPADGDLFKRLREAAQVTEDEMQNRIKVGIGYLRAIEGNRFERLPQAVFVKGFLRSYFRYLMVPEAEKLVTAFSTRLSDWQASRKA
jgi:hypothetical protein